MSYETQYNTDKMMNNWFELQKNYFDAFKAFNSNSSDRNPLENSFWNNAMEHWWKSIKSDSTIEHEALFEKIIKQCQNYSFMGDQFSSLIDGMSGFNNKKDLAGFINKKFQDIESMFTQTPVNFSWSSFVDACEMPYEAMKNNASSNAFGFANLFEGFAPEIKKIRDQFLSIPGLGHSRETQDKLQKLIKLWAIYQDNNNEHQSVMSRLNQEALEMMRKKVLKMSKEGKNFDSMRQIYDLWVESNEKAYGDYAFTKEYADLNGRLVNSQMAFRKLSHEINEDVLTAMNMPTSRAMNELERRNYELGKKVKAMEFELKSLKEMVSSKYKVKEIKPDVIKKKKTTKKKISKKKIVSKPAVATATKKKVKKKVKKKRRSVKNDVIEIKF